VLQAIATAGCAVALSGCVTAAQNEAVRTFGTAASAVGGATASELVALREATIAMNVRRLELEGVQPEQPGPDDLDESFDPEAVELRVRAAGALQTYGDLLLVLIADSEREELARAADRLEQSIGNLPMADQRISQERLGALGDLVEGVGGILVERKKANALRQIVPEIDPQVAHLCELLAADLDPAALRLATGASVTAESLRVAADEALRSAPSRDERGAALAGLDLAAAQRTRNQTVLPRASQALKDLALAHAALSQAVTSGTYEMEDIRRFGKQARALLDALRVLAGGE
jgi:hypothetical protein